MPTSKPFYQSWTLWFNVGMAVYEVFKDFGVFEGLPPEVSAVVLLIGNILLRLKTTQAVHLT